MLLDRCKWSECNLNVLGISGFLCKCFLKKVNILKILFARKVHHIKGFWWYLPFDDSLHTFQQLQCRFSVFCVEILKYSAAHSCVSMQTLFFTIFPVVFFSLLSAKPFPVASHSLLETRKVVYILPFHVFVPWLHWFNSCAVGKTDKKMFLKMRRFASGKVDCPLYSV